MNLFTETSDQASQKDDIVTLRIDGEDAKEAEEGPEPEALDAKVETEEAKEKSCVGTRDSDIKFEVVLDYSLISNNSPVQLGDDENEVVN